MSSTNDNHENPAENKADPPPRNRQERRHPHKPRPPTRDQHERARPRREAPKPPATRRRRE